MRSVLRLALLSIACAVAPASAQQIGWWSVGRRVIRLDPAWNDGNLHGLSRVTRSSVVLAHVRAATAGLGVSQVNCHPFTNGRLAFMHNGAVGGFFEIKRKLQERLSDTAFAQIGGKASVSMFEMTKLVNNHLK